jgi:hypothetical protein
LHHPRDQARRHVFSVGEGHASYSADVVEPPGDWRRRSLGVYGVGMQVRSEILAGLGLPIDVMFI